MTNKKKRMCLLAGIFLLSCCVLFIVSICKREYWHYKFFDFSDSRALVLYEANVVFIFRDIRPNPAKSSSGVFPIDGWGTEYNTIDSVSMASDVATHLKFSYSLLKSDAIWKINDHRISIRKRGKVIDIDGQSVNWKNDALTLVVVESGHHSVHSVTAFPRDAAIEKLYLEWCPCPGPLVELEETSSGTESGKNGQKCEAVNIGADFGSP